MKRMHILVAATAASISFCTAAEATVIDFNGGVSPTTSYTDSGVTFTASGNSLGAYSSPNGTLALLGGAPGDSIFYPITATLSSPATFVSVDLGDFDADADTVFLEAYDSSNNLLGSTSLFLDASDSALHTLSLSFANIASARFGSLSPPSVGGSSVFGDNFTFLSAAVPEPATWMMMLLGFGAIGLAFRRKRETAAFA